MQITNKPHIVGTHKEQKNYTEHKMRDKQCSFPEKSDKKTGHESTIAYHTNTYFLTHRQMQTHHLTEKRKQWTLEMLQRYPETSVALPENLREWAIARGLAVRPLIQSPQERFG